MLLQQCCTSFIGISGQRCKDPTVLQTDDICMLEKKQCVVAAIWWSEVIQLTIDLNGYHIHDNHKANSATKKVYHQLMIWFKNKYVFLSAYTKVPSFNKLFNMFMDYILYDVILTMDGLEVSVSSLENKASSCCMTAGGGSTNTGCRQDSVESWTPWSGHDNASNSRDRSWKDAHKL